MTDPVTGTADGILLACSLAVRLSLQSAAKSVLSHRGRKERSRYVGVDPDDLYRALDPPATSAELDRWDRAFNYWWGLPSVLDDGDVPHIDMIMRACHEYVRTLMTSQAVHDPAVLRVWLKEVDRAAAG